MLVGVKRLVRDAHVKRAARAHAAADQTQRVEKTAQVERLFGDLRVFALFLQVEEQLAELLPKAIVIEGDGTDQELLLEEGILRADAFVSLTGIDEENMVLSLFAKDATDAKVVTKISRDNYLRLASELGLDCVISPKYLTSSNVVSYVRSLSNTADNEIESLYHVVGNQMEAIEFRIRDQIAGLVGIPLRQVRLKKNILICAVIRKREIIIPDGSVSIELGDSVVVVSKDYHFSMVKDILG